MNTDYYYIWSCARMENSSANWVRWLHDILRIYFFVEVNYFSITLPNLIETENKIYSYIINEK
jgi:hypothetical protein